MLETPNSLSFPPSLTDGLPLPVERSPEVRGERQLPPGTLVVSADNHWSITDDIFYDLFPLHLKDQAPRLRTDDEGRHHWEIGGSSLIPPGFKRVFDAQEAVPGGVSLEHRLRDLDAEGISKEVVFGNGVNIFLHYPDVEVREWVFRIYNQHLGEMQRRAPGRFYGVGLINFWDAARTGEALDEMMAQGLKTFMLPINPRGQDGLVLNYCHPDMDPVWETIARSGLPICFHVGEVFVEGPGGVGTTAMTSFAPFRKSLGELIFGGVFDRHPSLQVMFAEADINWVPGALQVAEMAYDCYQPFLQPKILHRPTHYWHQHCFTTFMHDPAGMRLLDLVGTNRVMWSSDYPHMESTFGYSWKAMQAVVDAVSDEEAKAILGGTAMKFFKLDE